MKNRTSVLIAILAVAWLSMAAAWGAEDDQNDHWPSFRGKGASGVSEGYVLPVQWNGETGENIKWQVEIPGLSHSSPIIWGERIFLTSAVNAAGEAYLRVGLYGESPDHPEEIEHDFRVYCLDKKTGKIVWQKSAYKGIPKVKRHVKATHANSTPATDGKYVVAFFGSEGLYCYDMNGELLWKKDLGLFDMGPPGVSNLQWGFASSPVIHQGRIYVVCAARNVSFVLALDAADGSEIWRTERPLYPGWHTPTVYEGSSTPQVVTNGYKHIGGYELSSGKEIWKMHGGGDVPVPAPIIAHELFYIANAHGGQSPVYAVKSTAKGDITLKDGETSNEYIAFALSGVRNYMQTPLAYGQLLYGCRNNGIMFCANAKSGDFHYKQRLDSGVGFTASPVAGDGKIYFTSEEGDVYVIKAGESYELLAKNTMGGICMASPAISQGNLYFRTTKHLVAIGK